MNGLLLGAGIGALLYALSRTSRSSSSTTPPSTTPAPPAPPRAPTPVASHAPGPGLPVMMPRPVLTGTPVVVMAGFNVGWPENIVATQSYMEANVPPAVEQVVAQLNTLGHGTFLSPRTMIRSTEYGYLATVLVLWSTSAAIDTTWLANTVKRLILARGGQVASHLRDVTASR